MKKLVAVLAAAVLAGGAIFAGDFYNGDIQIQEGIAFNTIKLDDVSQKYTATEFVAGVESWHLFKPMDMFGVGFVAGVNVGVGVTEKWSYTVNGQTVSGNESGLSLTANFEFGPAVGLYLGKIVRFGANICLDYGYNYDQPFRYSTTTRTNYFSQTIKANIDVDSSYIGFSTGLQAKFLPTKVCNPVVGWRMVKGFADSYNVSASISDIGIVDEVVNYSYNFTQNVLYAALSFSWKILIITRLFLSSQ